MRTPRFIISPKKEAGRPNLPLTVSSEVTVSPEESHHICNVLRLKPGDRFEGVCEEGGRSFICEITGNEGPLLSAVIISQLRLSPLPRLVVVVGAVRPAVADFIVEKAIELGASEIHFFFAERSQGPLKGEKLVQRKERLSRVARSAVKQSRTPISPVVEVHQSLEAALLLLHPSGEAQPLKTSEIRCVFAPPQKTNEPEQQTGYQTLIQLLPLKPSPATGNSLQSSPLEKVQESVESYLLIGPEGGLTESEIGQAESFGYIRTSLGPNTLRTETAVILACGLVQLANS